MPQRTRTRREEHPESTVVLLKNFPVPLHREMKAEAARRGLRVSAAYAEACALFLRRVAQARRRREP